MKAKTVIVFEDDEKIGNYVSEVLHDAGMDVIQAGCIKSSLPEVPFDLVICDLSHKNAALSNSLNEFRHEHEESKYITIIDPDQKIIDGLHNKDGILEKPFNASELLTVIHDLEILNAS